MVRIYRVSSNVPGATKSQKSDSYYVEVPFGSFDANNGKVKLSDESEIFVRSDGFRWFRMGEYSVGDHVQVINFVIESLKKEKNYSQLINKRWVLEWLLSGTTEVFLSQWQDIKKYFPTLAKEKERRSTSSSSEFNALYFDGFDETTEYVSFEVVSNSFEYLQKELEETQRLIGEVEDREKKLGSIIDKLLYPEKGKVTCVKDTYCFLKTESGLRVFAHKNDFSLYLFPPKIGEVFKFSVIEGDRGFRVGNITPI